MSAQTDNVMTKFTQIERPVNFDISDIVGRLYNNRPIIYTVYKTCIVIIYIYLL